jgi:hypothetical protein
MDNLIQTLKIQDLIFSGGPKSLIFQNTENGPENPVLKNIPV